jgi:hypothetical protein
MAYISTEEIKVMREALKNEFNGKNNRKLKFSITRQHYSTVVVSIMEGNLDFKVENHQVNPYYFDHQIWKDQPEALAVLKRISEIVNGIKKEENRNAGDPYADYSDYNYYFNLHVGKWDKPYKKVA